MDLATFLLLLGFALTKLAIAAAIVWLGLRSGARPDEDEGFGRSPGDGVPPRGPPRRRTGRSPARGGPARSPVRRLHRTRV